jgi:DNA-directed RNA polymerase specialized sigma24 family protein
MKELLLTKTSMAIEQNERIQQTVQKERKRLLHFIRQRVNNVADAEDILQDVFYQFTEYLRLGSQIDSITGWLFALFLSEILADPSARADTPMWRKMLSETIMEAIDELPAEQREVFLQHEIAGKSFKEMSAATGLSINTLLSRKRYAVLYLRERLAELYRELLND